MACMSEEQSAVTTAIPKYGLPAPLPALFLSGTFPFLCFLCSQLLTSFSEPEDYRGNADIKFFGRLRSLPATFTQNIKI